MHESHTKFYEKACNNLRDVFVKTFSFLLFDRLIWIYEILLVSMYEYRKTYVHPCLVHNAKTFAFNRPFTSRNFIKWACSDTLIPLANLSERMQFIFNTILNKFKRRWCWWCLKIGRIIYQQDIAMKDLINANFKGKLILNYSKKVNHESFCRVAPWLL